MTIASLKTILLSLVDNQSSTAIALTERINSLRPDDFYLELDILDSFSLNTFIVLVETEFDVTLSANDIQSYEFRTLSGLISIIQSKNLN